MRKVGQEVRAAGSHSALRVWVLVVGVSSLLVAAVVVASAAVAGRSSAPHVGAPTHLVAPAAPLTKQLSEPLATPVTTTSAPVPQPGPTVGAIGHAVAAKPSATNTPSRTTNAPPHFNTPEAAMTYLAAAWNAHDAVALAHVTTPAARVDLDAMRREAVNLRLDRCDRQAPGDYLCFFRHDYPSRTSTTVSGGGQAVFLVGPALIPGWYMTVLRNCG